ncbi:hypothetical protein BHE74_00031737 [Ensete ventricosum]|nr:hypothetical protein GW17_00058880 [Ensete ventricosum]RWW61217.1 hypothetical protein BHE74_00031737 [Ensete ventricosum]
MGVDPDNHRLTQKALLRRSRSSHGATLSTDAVSSYENMKCNSTVLPDLNLDLTICTPSALEGQRLEKTATPTLLLFQDAGDAERRGKKLKEKVTDVVKDEEAADDDKRRWLRVKVGETHGRRLMELGPSRAKGSNEITAAKGFSTSFMIEEAEERRGQ